MLRVLVVTLRKVSSGGGGAYRTFNIAKYLSKVCKCSVTLIAKDKKLVFVNGHIIEEEKIPTIINFLSILTTKIIEKFLITFLRFPYEEVGRVSSILDLGLLILLLRELLRIKYDIVLVEEYYSLVLFASFLKRFVPHVKLIIFDAHNVDSDRIAKIYPQNELFITLVRSLESLACKLSDLTIVTSTRDMIRMRALTKCHKRIEVIPNFVILDEIEAQIKQYRTFYEGLTMGRRPIVIFHGDFRYAPNRESLKIILNEIMPKVIKATPEVLFVIVGPGLPRFKSKYILSLGYVDRLYALISVASIAIVPILRGGGTRIKILEYMACGVPVISTLTGAEGLDLENFKHIVLAEITEFPRYISELINDKTLREEIIYNAKTKVKEFHVEIILERLVKLMVEMLRGNSRSKWR